MAAITPTSVIRHSIGDLSLLIVNITTGSTSDTWTTSTNMPVVGLMTQPQTGSAITGPDVTYTASTGVFLFSNATSQFGVMQLFVLVGN